MSFAKGLLLLLGAVLCFNLTASEQKKEDKLLASARAGDAQSQLLLADEYFFGRNNRKVNPQLAAYWYRKSASDGNARAQFNYGVCCLKGWGVPASPQTGFLWISRAAEQGVEEALIIQAELLFRGLEAELDSERRFPSKSAEPEKALAILRKLVSRKSARAAKALARLLLSDTSLRVKHSFELRDCAAKAVRSMPRDVESVLIYSTVLQNGIGGATDMKKAISLLHGIEDISPEAMARLSEIYEYGLSVTPDPERALTLCFRAVKMGSPRAMLALGNRYLEANRVGHDPAKAVKLFSQAWSAGYPGGASSLGKCYLNAIGTEKNIDKAFELFMQGANLGDPESQYQLGLCFKNGIGCSRDTAGAVHWFKSAASSGHADASRELGISLIRGEGTEQNIPYGRELLRAAARKGDVKAIEFLQGKESI